MSEEPMSEERELVTFRTVGEAVRFDPGAKMWSLTEMHRAAGAPKHKAPHEWLRGAQAQELIAALVERETTGNSRSFVETREGRNGGTWAHWQIAAAYAHYLNPHFYLQWNEWAMAYATGRQDSAALARLEARVAALEGRKRPKPEGARVLLRRTIERVVEEVELRDVPARPINAAIRAVLRQAGRPLRPIEVTALLSAAGVEAHPTQVSGGLWHMFQRSGDVTRDADGRYTLTSDE